MNVCRSKNLIRIDISKYGYPLVVKASDSGSLLVVSVLNPIETSFYRSSYLLAKGSRLDMRSTSNPAFRNDSEVNFSVRNRKFSDASESEYSSRAATNVSEAQKISKKPSFFALSAQEERSTFSYAPSGKNSNHSEEFNYEPVRRGTISSVDSAGRSDRKNGVAANKQSSSNSTQSKSNSRNSFSIAAFFHPRSNSNTKENIAKRPSNATLSSGKNPTVLSGSSNGKESSKDPRKFSVGSKADKNEAGFSNNAAAFARVVNASPDGETANVADDYDMIYNLMDNYTALICCAFLHVDLIKSLYFLGMNGTVPLAMKSRDLLVDFLRTLAHILPDSRCSELLTIPSLLEVASTVGGGSVTRRAHKSSQILVALADAFSVMPYKQVSGSHVSGLNGNTSNGTNRSRSISYAQPSRNSSLAGNAAATAMITGTGPISSAIRSNFPSLNIQTLFELAEEIKISSFTNIASATSDVSSGSILSGATNDLVTSLRESITPNIEKNDFMKQMELSRVIGKEVSS